MAGGVELASGHISLSVRYGSAQSQILADFNRTAAQAGQRINSSLVASLNRGNVGQALASQLANHGRPAAQGFFRGFTPAAQRSGATAGAGIGRLMGVGITTGLRSVNFAAGAVFAPLERAGVAAARRTGAVMASTLRTSLTSVLGFGGAGAIGYTLFSGLDRLKTLESAKIQLGVMKKSAGEIKQITDDILTVVSGTPIPLDKAMQAVPQALGAGVKQGKELVRYIEAIGNMTAATGGQRDFQDIATIMGQISRNKSLTLEDMQQLSEGGVDLRSALQSAFNWDDKTFEKNLKNHKITLDQIETAVEKSFGTGENALTKKMGDTFEGAVSKMHSSIARTGANFLGAMFGAEGDPSDPLKGATAGINKVTEKLGELERWVGEHRADIREFFHSVGDVARDVAGSLTTLAGILKDHPTLIKAIPLAFIGWKSITAVTALVSTFKQLKEILTGIPGLARTAGGALGDMPAAVSGGNGGAAAGRTPPFVAGPGGGGLAGLLRWLPLLGVGAQENQLDPNKVLSADDLKAYNDAIARGDLKTAEDIFVRALGGGGGGSAGLNFNPGSLNLTLTPQAHAADTVPFNPGPKAPQYRNTPAAPASSAVPGAAAQAGAIPAGVPYGLSGNPNSGGYGGGGTQFPDWVNQVAKEFGIKPSTYPGHQSDDRKEAGLDYEGYAPNPNHENRGIDWTGPVENLQRFADYLATIPGALEQVIWENPNTHKKTGIGGGKINPGYYPQSTYDVHGGNDPNNIHVHTRQSRSIPLPGDLLKPAPPLGTIMGLPAVDPTGGLLGRTTTDGGSAAKVPGLTGPKPKEQLPFGTPKGGVEGPQAAVRQAMLDAGFPAESWEKLDYIIAHESNYNVNATNPDTGDWGIPQFNPAAGNIEKYLPDRSTDPYKQGAAMMQYIKDRYGSIEAAYDFKQANGWYAAGGGISGPGTATSDSIPAMLSDGEHVLTAADVKAMGGQQGVYAFRNALHRAGGGAITIHRYLSSLRAVPGFDIGGGVDADTIQNAQDNVADLDNQVQVNQARLNEALNNGAEEAEIAAAQHDYDSSMRDLKQAQEALPYIMRGATPPDHTAENNVYNADHAAVQAQAQLDALIEAGDAPASQMLQAQHAVETAKRDQQRARDEFTKGQGKPDFFAELLRTQGYIPAAASSTGVAGTSSLAGILNLGNEAVGGLIDTGASLAQMAISAGISAGTFGAGAAAGPAAGAAAGYGIQMLANTAKRGVSYGFQMASIAADAGVEQLFPFGAPRWLGYDYTGFAPQIGIQKAFLTTVEKAGGQAIQEYFNPQQKAGVPPLPDRSAPVDMSGMSGQVSVTAPTPGLAGAAGVGSATAGGPSAGAPSVPPPPPGNSTNASPPTNLDAYKQYIAGGGYAAGGPVGIYDEGGWLPPGGIAINKSKRVEPMPVFNANQWDTLQSIANTPAPELDPASIGAGPDNRIILENVTVGNADELRRKLDDYQTLRTMRYRGRPSRG